MAYVNKVILVGVLGKDPELQFAAAGKAYLQGCSLATNEWWTDKSGQRQEHTEWHNLEVWGKTAEHMSQYLHKGSQLYVEGSLKTHKYQDKQGIDRFMTKIVVHRVQFLDRKSSASSEDDVFD